MKLFAISFASEIFDICIEIFNRVFIFMMNNVIMILHYRLHLCTNDLENLTSNKNMISNAIIAILIENFCFYSEIFEIVEFKNSNLRLI